MLGRPVATALAKIPPAPAKLGLSLLGGAHQRGRGGERQTRGSCIGQPCPPRLDNGKFSARQLAAGDRSEGGNSCCRAHAKKSHPSTTKRSWGPQELGGAGELCSAASRALLGSSAVGGTALSTPLVSCLSASHLAPTTGSPRPRETTPLVPLMTHRLRRPARQPATSIPPAPGQPK